MNQSNIYEYLQNQKDTTSLLIITRDDREATEVADVARVASLEPFVLPDIRVSVGEDLRAYQEEIYTLLSTLWRYFHSTQKRVLISPIRTILIPLPKEEYFGSKTIEFGDTIKLHEFKEHMYSWGYHFVDIASSRGELSVRGDIIDIYPIDSTKPYRLSLFDDEVESIRVYDEDTQKSVADELESIEITPTYLDIPLEEFEAWKSRCQLSSYDTFIKDIDSLGFWHLDNLAHSYVESFESILASDMASEIVEIYSLDTPLIEATSLPVATIPPAKNYRDLEVVKPNPLLQAHKDKKITIVARNESIIRGSELESFDGLEILYVEGIVNILSDEHLIISLNKPIKKRRVKKASIILDELKPNDYIVHENHGVGLFKGIEKREILGSTREFLVINYQNEDTLLVPVENLEVVDRYVAEGGTLPALDKLGKASFKRLKGKVREKLFAIASQIINLSAQRHLQKGIVIKLPSEEYQIFMHKAGFVHTEDQKRAIDEMLADMSSGKMMDRLLSADVGFGKTEVAMNGMFAAAHSGYQSMIIAPTTLLSSQHFKSLKERFEGYDFKVAKLDRFTTAKEKRGVLSGLADGTIDMVVGTHSLLKAKFDNLALVVIDEEHKFGVKQKEALKELSSQTHLLSMSATPIPRSLNLALSQIKTFSEILTPPLERQGVRTFVKSYDDKVIKEAIMREMRRGGQTFYVYNSIAGIEQKRKDLLEILPKLRIAVLHSKISAVETENEMMLFESGEYDLLLSTSIVESGIHMPHANTMIVDGADNFGIADLHQLRGRVGRGGKEGFCYFVVEDKESLSDNARRRLLALESHSQLGSGAVLAFHDLEIRGGGNIIGEAQSGHIKQIGYSLYLRMLEDTIKELSGIKKDEERTVDIKLSVDAYLNEDLIYEDRLRLELYRRLSQCDNVGEVYEIESEIADRFGKLDTITRQFIDIIIIKVLAREQGITKVSSYEQRVFIEFADESKERAILQSPSKDDDDIIATAMKWLKGNR
ncbi:Transcription-repair coupling factor [hydrothermal vent metagenome]|uniref:Transcription-repair coupling factor n=1 Tax=hydrothermal vent metagenome TaxID=652676 RepID=A0A1W1BBA4_9ZZZZ